MLSELTISAVTAGSLVDFTRHDLIVPQLCERDAAGIISELSGVLGRSNCIPDVLSFYQAVLNQELLSDSAARSDIAVAHARLNGVNRLQFAFGRTPIPVVWNAKGSWPVQLIFLLAVPATETTHYLQVLASLARLGQSPDVIARLLAAADENDVLLTLKEIRL